MDVDAITEALNVPLFRVGRYEFLRLDMIAIAVIAVPLICCCIFDGWLHASALAVVYAAWWAVGLSLRA